MTTDIERLDARLRRNERLIQQVERVLRERNEPQVRSHLDKGTQDEILIAASYEFLRLAAERNDIIAALREIQRKYVRTGLA